MLTIFLFFLSIKITATLGCAIIAYKIAKLNTMTPTLTYMLFSIAFSIAVGLQIFNLFNASSISQFLRGYSTTSVLITQILSAAVYALPFFAFIRQYAAIKFTTKK